MEKVFNINFPIQDSQKGYFVDMTEDQVSGLLADIKHVLLTTKGSRYYRPYFGSNLRRLLFEPNDEITHTDIKGELNSMLNRYFPNVTVVSIEISTGVDPNPLFNENLKGQRTSSKPPSRDNIAKIRITLKIQRGSFESTEIIDLQF